MYIYKAIYTYPFIKFIYFVCVCVFTCAHGYANAFCMEVRRQACRNLFSFCGSRGSHSGLQVSGQEPVLTDQN